MPTQVEAEMAGGCCVAFLVMVVVGIPFFLWSQGNVWGQITGVLSGVLIYGTGLILGLEKILGSRKQPPDDDN